MGQPTYEEIIAEARVRRHAAGYGPGANLGSPPLEHFIIEIVREAWTPPVKADPDLEAFRGWLGSRGLLVHLPAESFLDTDLHKGFIGGLAAARIEAALARHTAGK